MEKPLSDFRKTPSSLKNIKKQVLFFLFYIICIFESIFFLFCLFYWCRKIPDSCRFWEITQTLSLTDQIIIYSSLIFRYFCDVTDGPISKSHVEWHSVHINGIKNQKVISLSWNIYIVCQNWCFMLLLLDPECDVNYLYIAWSCGGSILNEPYWMFCR